MTHSVSGLILSVGLGELIENGCQDVYILCLARGQAIRTVATDSRDKPIDLVLIGKAV